MKKLLLLPFVLIPCLSISQIGDSLIMNESVNNYNIFDMEILMAQNPLSIGARTFDLSYEGVKGTPFLYDEFKKAELIIDNEDKKVKTEVQIYLDIYKHEVIAVIPGDQYLNLQGDQVLFAKFLEENRLFKAIPADQLDDRPLPFVFAEILHDGVISLLKITDKDLRKADYSGAYGSTGTRYDEFLLRERYWLATPNGGFEKIKLSKKSILKALPEQADRIKAISKKEKLSLLTEGEVISLLKLLAK